MYNTVRMKIIIILLISPLHHKSRNFSPPHGVDYTFEFDTINITFFNSIKLNIRHSYF